MPAVSANRRAVLAASVRQAGVHFARRSTDRNAALHSQDRTRSGGANVRRYRNYGIHSPPAEYRANAPGTGRNPPSSARAAGTAGIDSFDRAHPCAYVARAINGNATLAVVHACVPGRASGRPPGPGGASRGRRQRRRARRICTADGSQRRRVECARAMSHRSNFIVDDRQRAPYGQIIGLRRVGRRAQPLRKPVHGADSPAGRVLDLSRTLHAPQQQENYASRSGGPATSAGVHRRSAIMDESTAYARRAARAASHGAWPQQWQQRQQQHRRQKQRQQPQQARQTMRSVDGRPALRRPGGAQP